MQEETWRREETSSQLTALREWRKRQAEGSDGMTQILPNLYLGSMRDANNVEQLREKKIQYILSIHGLSRSFTASDDLSLGNQHIHGLHIKITDAPEVNISERFGEAIAFIHRARSQKCSVLVHCVAGVSRSVCVVAAYLIATCDMSYVSALAYITRKRPCANPNFGFRMQLAKYASEKAQSEIELIRSQLGKEAFDELKEDDKKFLFSRYPLPDTQDEPAECSSAELPVPVTSVNEKCDDHSKHYNNASSRSAFSGDDMSFIDQ